MCANKTDPTFVVFIDEAGDEGFKFKSKPSDSGSSDWFVLSGAVFRKDDEVEQVKSVDRARAALGRDAKKPLHFRQLKHEQRIVYCREVAKSRFSAVNVAVFKPELEGRQHSRQKMWMYHFAAKLLLERVSWLCRDRFADKQRELPGNGSAKIIISNRSAYSQADFQEYLLRVKERERSSVDWNVINVETVECRTHEELRGLQVADVLASSLFSALEPHPLDVLELSYMKLLVNRYYKRADRILSYGLKSYPSEGHQLIDKHEAFNFIAGSQTQ